MEISGQPYDVTFQRELLATILCHKKHGAALSAFTELHSAFDSEVFQAAVAIATAFYSKYDCPPTQAQLTEELGKLGFAGIQKSINSLYTPPSAPEYYVEEASKYIHFVKLQQASLEMQSCLQIGDLSGAVTAVNVLNKFAGVTTDHGVDFFTDHRNYVSDEIVVPTGIQPIDYYLNGGLGVGELGSVIAPPNRGKSFFLLWIAGQAVKNGAKVVYYTLEMRAPKVRRRFDSMFTNIPYRDIADRTPDVVQAIEAMRQEYGQSLYIKQYPTRSVNTNNLRAHLAALHRTLDFAPDLIVVDYADLMRSNDFHGDRRIEQGAIYEDLRAAADLLQVPVWTASQANRESIDKPVFGMENISESLEKAMVADVLLTLCQTPNEKKIGVIRIYFAKNRSDESGIEIEVKTNFANSTFCENASVL